ncbi:MAG: hypothetical protein IKD44_04800, partial [Lentisphaeria bacterium]|nr:hypothetical protein [Lentisphaeria bacterium]
FIFCEKLPLALIFAVAILPNAGLSVLQMQKRQSTKSFWQGWMGPGEGRENLFSKRVLFLPRLLSP